MLPLFIIVPVMPFNANMCHLIVLSVLRAVNNPWIIRIAFVFGRYVSFCSSSYASKRSIAIFPCLSNFLIVFFARFAPSFREDTIITSKTLRFTVNCTCMYSDVISSAHYVGELLSYEKKKKKIGPRKKSIRSRRKFCCCISGLRKIAM